jgi:hypothetical protein
VVRGGATTWIAVLGVLSVPVSASAQYQQSRYPLPTDTLVSPAPAVPPRTSYQPARQPPGVPEEPDFTLPDGSVIPVPQGKAKQFRFTRRYGTPNTLDSQLLPDGTRRFVFTGGVIVNATADNGDEIEFATDDAVVWVRGLAIDQPGGGFRTTPDGKTEVEAYLAGNVIIRTRTPEGPQTLRAAEVYYDVERERAVALSATLEYNPTRFTDPVRFHGQEIRRLDADNWESIDSSFDASRLPSDPRLRIDARRATLSQRRVTLRNAFGIPYRDLRTGERLEGEERLVTAYGVVPRLAGVPLFYFPRLRTDASDPLGPFVGLGVGQSRMFGTQVSTTWDLFDLLALRPPPGHRWLLNADYLSARGPALGSDYNYNLPAAKPGLAPTVGLIRLYGINDNGTDLLGGDRGPQLPPPTFRGRASWRHQQEVLEGVYFQGQIAYLSDQNFLEQYYKQEFDLGPNQETFVYLSGNRRNLWAAGLAQYRLDRPWIAETMWLPRVDAAIVGQSFFDLFVYSAKGSAAYARARPSATNPWPVLSTDQRIDTGRFDVIQELSIPFSLGPLKFAPYGTLDTAAYTDDLNGDAVGRIWGGGGLRGSLPFSRLYEGVSSDLLNLRGLYHKAELGANYLYARTNVPFTRLPLLDRLNDDATDQGWRNITPFQTSLVPGPNGLLLAQAGSPGNVYNPQRYMIRRLATDKPDTLDNINVLQLDLRHRFQTKRGYPGQEHTVDVLSLGTSISFFPEAGRDNFGNGWSFLEYDAVWNLGDRTSLVSSGWFEPYQGGSRYYSVGAFLNRTDRTNFFIGYSQVDPVNSRAVTGSVGYQLSKRYYVNAAASYDFGIRQALSNSLLLSRTGSDLTISIGVTYNSLVNNLGVQFLVTPNLFAALNPGRFGGTQLGANPGVGRLR